MYGIIRNLNFCLSLQNWRNQFTLLLLKKIIRKRNSGRTRTWTHITLLTRGICQSSRPLATMTCWEIELNNRIYINLKLATTPKELEIHHGNFLWVSDSLSLPLIQKLLTDVYYQFSSKNSPLFSPSWVKIFFSKIFVKIFM